MPEVVVYLFNIVFFPWIICIAFTRYVRGQLERWIVLLTFVTATFMTVVSFVRLLQIAFPT